MRSIWRLTATADPVTRGSVHRRSHGRRALLLGPESGLPKGSQTRLRTKFLLAALSWQHVFEGLFVLLALGAHGVDRRGRCAMAVRRSAHLGDWKMTFESLFMFELVESLRRLRTDALFTTRNIVKDSRRGAVSGKLTKPEIAHSKTGGLASYLLTSALMPSTISGISFPELFVSSPPFPRIYHRLYCLLFDF